MLECFDHACHRRTPRPGQRPARPTPAAGRRLPARRLPRRPGLHATRRAGRRPRALRARLRARLGDRPRARRGQLHAGRHAARSHAAAVQRLEGRSDARPHDALAPQRRLRRDARGRVGHAPAAGQRDLEAALGQGAARPPGRGLHGVARAEEHDDVLDRARRHGRRPRHDLLRPRLASVAPAPAGGQFHAPDDWLGYLREVVPPDTEIEAVPIEVPAGAPRSTTAGRGTARRRTSAPTPSAGRSSRTWSRATRSGATPASRIRCTAATAGRASASWTMRSSRSCGARAASRPR